MDHSIAATVLSAAGFMLGVVLLYVGGALVIDQLARSVWRVLVSSRKGPSREQ
jgi:hypothetical protein